MPISEANEQLLSAKRTAQERKGVHAWHPYYAGYSEAFVESAISYLGATSASLVLDPWGGSGTTGIVAARRGVPSLCLDINPVMSTFAAAKSAVVLEHKVAVRQFIDNLPRVLPGCTTAAHPAKSPSTSRKFTLSTDAAIQGIIAAIQANNQLDKLSEYKPHEIAAALRDGTSAIAPLRAFLMSVLFVTLRNIAGPKRLANPTWVRENAKPISISYKSLMTELKSTADEMLSDLGEFFRAHTPHAINYALAGDTREMPITSDSVSCVVTSPPYLTRIDYAVSTSPELTLVGGESLISTIRHKTMGATVITKDAKVQQWTWGKSCNSLLNAIAAHPTKAARSYYWKNIVQYFMDMESSLREIYRVLRPSGGALVVVQSSYFKDIEMPLGDIYVEMSANLGFQAEIAYREKVKGHMAHVNTKSSKYSKDKTYFEDFVHLRKL